MRIPRRNDMGVAATTASKHARLLSSGQNRGYRLVAKPLIEPFKGMDKEMGHFAPWVAL